MASRGRPIHPAAVRVPARRRLRDVIRSRNRRPSPRRPPTGPPACARDAGTRGDAVADAESPTPDPGSPTPPRPTERPCTHRLRRARHDGHGRGDGGRRAPGPLEAAHRRRLVQARAAAAARDPALRDRRTGQRRPGTTGSRSFRSGRGTFRKAGSPPRAGTANRGSRRATSTARRGPPTSGRWRPAGRRRARLLPGHADHGPGPPRVLQLRRGRWLVRAHVVHLRAAGRCSSRRRRRRRRPTPATGSPCTWTLAGHTTTCCRPTRRPRPEPDRRGDRRLRSPGRGEVLLPRIGEQRANRRRPRSAGRSSP